MIDPVAYFARDGKGRPVMVLIAANHYRSAVVALLDESSEALTEARPLAEQQMQTALESLE